MKPHVANLINAIVLILLGLWSYFSADVKSVTALIPVIIGVILLVLSPGVKKENKVIAHIAVVLTLLMLVGLFKPLTGAIDRESQLGIIRIVVMMIFTAFAIVAFVRSFIQTRKNRS